MAITRSVEIEAPPSRVWDVLLEVERWPDWTASLTQIDLLDRPELTIGARARIRQPRLPAAVWTVTEFAANQRFTWEAASFGGTMIASHALEPQPNGRTRVVLTAHSRGLHLRLLSFPFARITRRYVEMEAQGLKRQCEMLDD